MESEKTYHNVKPDITSLFQKSEEQLSYVEKYNQWYRRAYDDVPPIITPDPYPLSNYDWDAYRKKKDTMEFPFIQLPSPGSNVPRERNFKISRQFADAYNQLYSEYVERYNFFLDKEEQLRRGRDRPRDMEEDMVYALDRVNDLVYNRAIQAIVHIDQDMHNYDAVLIRFQPSPNRDRLDAIFSFTDRYHGNREVVLDSRDGCVEGDCLSMQEYMNQKFMPNSPFAHYTTLPHETLYTIYSLTILTL